MPIIAKASGANFVPAPSGAHSAVCVDVVDCAEPFFATERNLQPK